MNLAQVRAQFVKLSGRFDLVSDLSLYTDNGADFFIQEASRLLDRKSVEISEDDSAFYSVALGGYYIDFTNIRSIKELWYHNTTDRYQLIECTKNTLKTLFASILDTTNTGIPAYYAPVRGNIRTNVANGNGEASLPANFLNGLQLASTDINAVIFSPINPAGTIEIVGKFYSLPLTANASENYWTIHHPMLLVWAACYLLEVSYRNSEGAKDWMGAIGDWLKEIEMDIVEERTNNMNQMGGRENE